MKSILKEIVRSLYFKDKIKKMRFRNPFEREFLESNWSNEKKLVKDLDKKDVIFNDKMINSYEYKVKDHISKVHYDNKVTKYDKLPNFEFLNKDEYWEYQSKYKIVNLIKKLKFNRLSYYYDIPSNYNFKLWERFALLLILLIAFKLGYINALKDCELIDEVKYSVKEIKTEDQIFDILLNTNKPLILLYYIPGDEYYIDMLTAMGNLAVKYDEILTFENNKQAGKKLNLHSHTELFNLAKVNCKDNFDLCIRKSKYLKFPQWELMLPPDEVYEESAQKLVKKFPIVKCVNDRSFEGLEGFLMGQNIVQDIYNPLLIMNNGFNNLINKII